MKYALIAYNNIKHKRGAYTEADRLAVEYPDILTVFDGRMITNMDSIRTNCNRIVYTYQNPNWLRSNNLLDIKYYNKDIIYIRKNISTIYKYKTTNGFSMYLENPFYNNFVPMLLPMLYNNSNSNNIITIGYYIRPQYRSDDFRMFKDFISNLNVTVDLYVMGSFIFDFKSLNRKHINKMVYTTDNNNFFNNITHYVYSESSVFDPWPTTLQEAVNNNKQIIILEQNRNFNDGITDIKHCIEYHNKLNLERYYDNSKCILNKWNWNNYYLMVFDNNFEYVYDRNKYKYFPDWLGAW